MNPGGPGASGYLMPLKVTMFNGQSARLNERYDLIGFDPHGVNYSTKVNCDMRFTVAPGVTDEAVGKTVYDDQTTANKQCRQTDTDFMDQLSALTVARDLDRIRTALGERTLNYTGVSWGTYLGVIYRTVFPRNAGKMFLDSVVNLQDGTATLETENASAAERDFSRLAAWIARHNDTYHLGATTGQVRATVLAEAQAYQANPKQFTDMPPFDGAQIANLASQTQSSWPQVTAALAALLEAPGPAAPPAVQAIFSGQHTPQAPDAPEDGNGTATHVTACNDDSSRLDLTTAWSTHQQRLTQNPVTGLRNMFPPQCPGGSLSRHEIRAKVDQLTSLIKDFKIGSEPTSPLPGLRRHWWALTDRLDEATRQLVEDRQAGMTQAALVSRYGISLSSVKRLLRAGEVTRPATCSLA
jgi:pimeloyl-ACP methyl ester carboxylesterase